MKSSPYILAIDTSCDDSSVSIMDVENWKLLSEIVLTHSPSMTAFGGVVPELASREHLKALPLAVDQALKKAQLRLSQLGRIVVTNRPGLVGALIVGVAYAKSLAFSLEIPFSTLSHVESHLYSPLLCTFEGESGPAFPWVALIASGGHTELFFVEKLLSHRWMGGTLDDAAGEAFDKIGKLLGLPYPAGPVIDKWVKSKANAEDRVKHKFPRAKLPRYQFSYSGLKTAVALHLQKNELLADDEKLAVAASAQEAILDPIVNALLLAKKQWNASSIVVTGGVACNSRLRERLPDAYFPSPKHCTDNASMVGCLAALKQQNHCLVDAPWSETVSARETL